VNIVVGPGSRTKSVNTEKGNEEKRKLAMPNAAWDSVRGRVMRVLLEEHDNILQSFWAQKFGTKNSGDALRGPR